MAPRCRKKRLRTIWPWLKPSVSLLKISVSACSWLTLALREKMLIISYLPL